MEASSQIVTLITPEQYAAEMSKRANPGATTYTIVLAGDLLKDMEKQKKVVQWNNEKNIAAPRPKPVAKMVLGGSVQGRR